MVGNTRNLALANERKTRAPLADFFRDGLRLGGRRAWGSLMEDEFELGVNRSDGAQPSDRTWRRQRGAMREVDGYGVSKMADAAVLVFEGLVVPVAGCLESKRQHDSSDHNGQKPVCRSPLHIRTETPAQILLRRGTRCNRDYKFLRRISQFPSVHTRKTSPS
jgi:hypothetical protein